MDDEERAPRVTTIDLIILIKQYLYERLRGTGATNGPALTHEIGVLTESIKNLEMALSYSKK